MNMCHHYPLTEEMCMDSLIVWLVTAAAILNYASCIDENSSKPLYHIPNWSFSVQHDFLSSFTNGCFHPESKSCLLSEKAFRSKKKKKKRITYVFVSVLGGPSINCTLSEWGETGWKRWIGPVYITLMHFVLKCWGAAVACVAPGLKEKERQVWSSITREGRWVSGYMW